jgi:hypothetical protein
MKSVVDSMKTHNRQFDKNSGSALILVVVVTVLLAVVGVMFLMVARAGETQSGAVVQSKDLNAAVETVVNRINEVLVDDLFGQRLANPANPQSWIRDEVMVNGGTAPMDRFNIYSDEPWDGPGINGEGNLAQSIYPGPNSPNDDVWLPGQLDDFWLASIEPVWYDNGTLTTSDDHWAWPWITDLWGTLSTAPDSLYFQQFAPASHPIFNDGRAQAYQWIDDTVYQIVVSGRNVRAGVVTSNSPMGVRDKNNSVITLPYGGRADADGDGVSDSRWVQVPGLSTSRGEPVFAAVRIIDNCGMLNLNAANCFDGAAYNKSGKTTPFAEEWNYWDSSYALQKWHNNTKGSGRYLTEINYLPFLRGKDRSGNNFLGSEGDYWYNLMIAKGLFRQSGGSIYPFLPETAHYALLNSDSTLNGYAFFDISEELELRNRYMLTSFAEARFEHKDVANFTLDSGGGIYSALRVPRNNSNISDWYDRIDPDNFDKWDVSGNLAANTIPYTYDRRHISTFYSFDRTLRNGQPPMAYQQLRADGWTPSQIAATQQSVFWYPLLYSELKSVGLTPQRIIDAQRLFWPVGPVTTDIASPEELLKGASGKPYNNKETRRRILHLLLAFREYFLPPDYFTLLPAEQDEAKRQAALKSAQVVANLIDFADDAAPNPTTGGRQGPFHDVIYGSQANADCTFITGTIIDDIVEEIRVSMGLGNIIFNFGLTNTDVVFGYERQPFISEVYAKRNVTTGTLEGFSIELLNPYPDDLNLARAAIPSDAAKDIWKIRAADNMGISYIVVDEVSSAGINYLLTNEGQSVIKRDDTSWRFIYPEYEQLNDEDNSELVFHTLGQPNAATTSVPKGFQLAVADSGLSPVRLHELETLSIQGGGNPNDPNNAVTVKIADPNSIGFFDLIGSSAGVLNHVCTMNRPLLGSLPGRININTAPVHVIAAAIPPSLADPAVGTGPVTFSALQIAQAIVDHRETNPFTRLGDLLDVQADSNGDGTVDTYIFERYSAGGLSAAENVGSQSIDDDIEERHWILSNLANKFTVRSDTFTAYILVRLGTDGPQRRMIAIFDRSQVWDMNDRPRLVALHPVPDPR